MDPAEHHPGLTAGAPSARRAAGDAVVGWRYWQLDAATGLLRSVTHRRVTWPAGRALRAVCLIGGHGAPAAGCACGIHAAPDLDALRASGVCAAPGEALVVGRVALWGAVVHDEHGLRGEHAAPAHLSLVAGTAPDEAAVLERLRAYAVPVDSVAACAAVGEVTAAVLAFQAMSR